MSGLVVLSGYVSGTVPIDPPQGEVSWFEGVMSQDKDPDRYDAERQGCALSASTVPWADRRDRAHREDFEIGEGQLPLPGSDFREALDRKECSCVDNLTCQICCTHRDLMAYDGILHEGGVVLDPIRGKLGEFNVYMPRLVAEKYGIIEVAFPE